MLEPTPIARDLLGALNTALGEHDLDILDIVAVLAALDRLLLVEIQETVADARHAGATWDQIGGALGISRQAAHHAYSRHEAGR